MGKNKIKIVRWIKGSSLKNYLSGKEICPCA